MADHPLRRVLQDWRPAVDLEVLCHAFAPHGRDYVLIVQVAGMKPLAARTGTYEITLTHVVEVHYETRVRDDAWPQSWDDCVIDYAAWEAAGNPAGYVWGTNGSLTDPGSETPDVDAAASRWTARLGREMYSVTIETDRFKLSIVFHDARTRKLSDDQSLVAGALVPLPRPGVH